MHRLLILTIIHTAMLSNESDMLDVLNITILAGVVVLHVAAKSARPWASQDDRLLRSLDESDMAGASCSISASLLFPSS